jgi:ElaB/YqjD/DUF883 family membrane-anchored ribosome-binding protein
MAEETTTKQIQEDVARLVSDMSSLRRELGSKGRSKLEDLRDDAQEKLGEARDQAVKKAMQVDSYVHDKPWVAAGAAVAFGAVLGALLTRWRSRD